MNVSDRLKQIDSMALSEFDSLNEMNDHIDIFWNPKPEGEEDCNVGTEFKGMYMGIRTFTGENGAYHKFLLKTVDGTLVGLKDIKLIRDSLTKLNIGDAVYLKYLGIEKVKKGANKYHNFEIKAHKFDEIPEELQGSSNTGQTQTRKMDKEEDDPQAQQYIKELIEMLKTDKIEITAENIVAYAEHNASTLGIDGELPRIKRQVVIEAKKGNWST